MLAWSWVLLVAFTTLFLLWLSQKLLKKRVADSASQSGLFSVRGGVVLITGAAQGIGKQLAWRLARRFERLTLVILDCNEAGLKQLQQEIHDELPDVRVLPYDCDVADENEVQKVVSEVLLQVAPLPIKLLINNAGIVHGKPLEQLSCHEIRRTFEVNSLSHFWLVQQVLPSMKQTTECCMIVSMASVMGMTASTRLADYCGSKAAVIAFHECLRLELKKQHLHNRINTLLVCPMGVNTGMFGGVAQGTSILDVFARFLAPILPQEQVADRILEAICCREQLVITCASGWRGLLVPYAMVLARLLPVPVYDQILALAGGLTGMDTFVGHPRQKKKSSEQSTSMMPEPKAKDVVN